MCSSEAAAGSSLSSLYTCMQNPEESFYVMAIIHIIAAVYTDS